MTGQQRSTNKIIKRGFENTHLFGIVLRALLDHGLKEKEGREYISNTFKYASKRLQKKEAAVQSMFN